MEDEEMAQFHIKARPERIDVVFKGSLSNARFGTARDIIVDELGPSKNGWVTSAAKRDPRHTVVEINRLPSRKELSTAAACVRKRIHMMVGEDVGVGLELIGHCVASDPEILMEGIEPVGPDSFGGEDGMPAPSAKRIREELEAERTEHDATMSGLLKRHDVTITEKEREALVEDEGPTLREAKAVLDDIRALKERSKLGKLTKAKTVKKSAKELLERIGKISQKQAEAEARWKVEGMADDGTLDCRVLMKLLASMEERCEE